MDKSKLALGVALVAVVIAIGSLFSSHQKSSFGSLSSGVTNYNQLGISELKIASNCNDGFGYGGCTGTAIDGLENGTCSLAEPATGSRFEATSTSIFTCAAPGVAVGDRVFVNPQFSLQVSSATTTLSTVGGPNFPFEFIGASTTAANIISVELGNLTGTASSSFPLATSTWMWVNFH